MSKKNNETVVIRADMTKTQWTIREMKKYKVAYLMVAPFFILFFMFTVVPVVLSFLLGFTTFNMLEWPKWVFMDNYIRLFLDDEIFLLAIKNTLVFAAVTGPGSYLLSLFFAWFINELRPKVRAFVTLLFYAPSISGSVYLIWTVVFSGDQYGFANAWLTKLGLINKPILWFQNEKYIVPLIIAVALWTSLGTSFLTLIAGFQVVDRSLYEAGAVDGVKNRWQELWFITLPYMRPQLLLSAILAITGAFGFGGVITALVGFPSPNYCAWTIMHHLEDYGWSRFEMGYASAIATLLFLMMIGANLLVNKLLRKVGT
ncbi:MAG: sugar ABC transporter permease [Clostridia bacterium]|jgi:multiple sugar transport system permease protein|nr:sugar ABC transporter permease [Clostridia bacterium]MBP5238465.1 sugar ABC transporter permease [Clostridia bacterium]MBP5754659.1 sugar ABC transporter permease [Clostridia bacterium]